MDSLDALRRWNEKRTKVFEKLAKQSPKNFVVERKLKPMRMRPGEIGREDFAAWMGALAPEAGAVNEFRTKMYQSELRGLQNRMALNHINPHPGWSLWTGQNIPVLPRPSDPMFRHYMRLMDKEKTTLPPAHPGIQLFFQNTTNDAPLRGSGLSGGALTQLPRTSRGYKKVEAEVIANSRAQARQLTAMRSGTQAAPAPPPVLTALDEAKLSIATTIETIAQQLFRGIFTTDILRDLNSLSATIARNAPLMDSPALGELLRYFGDLTGVLRANAKNTGKEIAEDNLEEFADLASVYGEADARSLGRRTELDEGVKKERDTADAIYARLEAINDFLKKQFAVADRPIAERIAVARSALPGLGTNVDRKTYPTALREKFRMEAEQQAQKERVEAEQELQGEQAFMGEQAVFEPPVVAPEAPFTEAEIRAERERLIEQYLQDSVEARDAGDFETEEANIRGALELADLNNDAEASAAIRGYLVERGYEARPPRRNRGEYVEPPPEPPSLAELAGEPVLLPREVAPAAEVADVGAEIERLLEEARMAAIDEDFGTEEAKIREALAVAQGAGDNTNVVILQRILAMRGYERPASAEEEAIVEEGASPAGRASAATAGEERIPLEQDDIAAFFKLFTGDPTERPDPDVEVFRRGTAWDAANKRIKDAGRRKISDSKNGSMSARAYFKQLDERGFVLDNGDGTFSPASKLIS